MEHITSYQWMNEAKKLSDININTNTLLSAILRSKLIEDFYNCSQTEELCKNLISKCGYMLVFVKNQTEEICKLAVQQDGYALQFVNNQTEEICKLAVQRNKYALEYVKNQTEEICKIAVQNNYD